MACDLPFMEADLILPGGILKYQKKKNRRAPTEQHDPQDAGWKIEMGEDRIESDQDPFHEQSH
jgi:hypothetical protein